ncbi:MAG: FHA domain-containing protein [Dehalococcoidia bacterium]
MPGIVPSRFALELTPPGGAPTERELPEGEVTIGRADSSDIVLADSQVSRTHARIRVAGDSIRLEDAGSSNGTYVNGERTTAIELQPGDHIGIGTSDLRLVVRGVEAAPTLVPRKMEIAVTSDGTVVLQNLVVADPQSTQILAPVAAPRPVARQERGVVTDEMLSQPVISEHDLISNGVEVKVAECMTLGGGIGSFIFTSHARSFGVPQEQMLVASNETKGYARYRRLVQNSQIPDHERLRSNSDACPGNPWGFPGYAAREIFRELFRGNIPLAARISWQIFAEPTFAPTFTPRTGDVWREMDREAARIGYDTMLVVGRIRAIRKTREGRILAVVSQSEGSERKHVAVSARFVHLCPGYPSLQFLDDLATYREKYDDRTRVVNAYEQHEHVYTKLRKDGGTVILRGRGIVASRIIQRVWEARKENKNISVIHLHRSKLTEGAKFGLARRKIKDDFEFQPFNWPKSNWTGQNRVQLEAASPEERKRLLAIWGGTTTADRPDWIKMVSDGKKAGWYRVEYGAAEEVSLSPDGKVVTRIQSRAAGGGRIEIEADFVIDCTGLIASPERSPMLADLIDTYDLPKNPLGRLHVSNDFEIEAMRHDGARMYAAGAIILGGPYATVDSFLGLQYATLRALKHMRSQGLRSLHNFWLNPLYSFIQWLKWARGAKP